MTDVIEIDLDAPCVSPRLPPTERLTEALSQIGFELVTLEDALRGGATLTDEQKRKLVSIGNRMVRRAS